MRAVCQGGPVRRSLAGRRIAAGGSPGGPAARSPLTPSGLAKLLACLAVPLVSSACVRGGISAKGVEVHRLFYLILWLALAVFVFVEGMLLVAVVRFRRRRGDGSEPRQDAGGRRTLAVFFGAPLAIILVLLALGESALARVDRNDPKPAERLIVTGFQWAWTARYVNEGITVTGKTLKQTLSMQLPVNRAARIELRATDVMHEFFVPDLLFMKNAVPGHPNVFTVTPTRTGTYHGQCAQFCGLWHSKMALELKVVPQADFASWVAKQKEAAANAGSCAPPAPGQPARPVSLVASQISWDKACVAVSPGGPFQVTIDNKDRGIAHNFAVYQNATLAHRLFLSRDVTGPGTLMFTVPALPPGKYYFQCDIHGPAMAGTLVVG